MLWPWIYEWGHSNELQCEAIAVVDSDGCADIPFNIKNDLGSLRSIRLVDNPLHDNSVLVDASYGYVNGMRQNWDD